MNRNRFIAIPAMALLAAVGGGTAAADELTLREIMVQLEADLQEMTAAIMREDFASVAAAARAIADHPEPGAGERSRVLGRLGTDAFAFRNHDKAVHDAAEDAARAAEAGDMDAVLRHHGRVMEHCVACHTEFKDRVQGE